MEYRSNYLQVYSLSDILLSLLFVFEERVCEWSEFCEYLFSVVIVFYQVLRAVDDKNWYFRQTVEK